MGLFILKMPPSPMKNQRSRALQSSCSLYTLTISFGGVIIIISGYQPLDFADIADIWTNVSNLASNLLYTEPLEYNEISVKNINSLKPYRLKNSVDIYGGFDILYNVGKIKYIYIYSFLALKKNYICMPYIIPFVGILVNLFCNRLNLTKISESTYNISNYCFKKIKPIFNYQSLIVYMNTGFSGTSGSNDSNNNDKNSEKKGPKKPYFYSNVIFLAEREILTLDQILNNFTQFLMDNNVRYSIEGESDLPALESLNTAQLEEALTAVMQAPRKIYFSDDSSALQRAQILEEIQLYISRVQNLHQYIMSLLSQIYELNPPSETDQDNIYYVLINKAYNVYAKYREHFT